jgi:hypothetical protein
MNAKTKVVVETGERVVAFCLANPSDNPGQEAAVARLKEQVTTARGLLDQEVTGVQTVHGSVEDRGGARGAISGMVRVLVGVAKSAKNELPATAITFRIRSGKSSAMLFVSQARSALAKGVAHREVLERYGLAPGFLDELKGLIDRYEETQRDTWAGRRAHTGAHAYLITLHDDILDGIRQLDALQAHRFRNDPERAGAWKSARDVHWPNGQSAKVANPPAA